jgi:hypothetical protein
MSRFIDKLSVVAPIFHLPKGTPLSESLKAQVTHMLGRSYVWLHNGVYFIFIFLKRILDTQAKDVYP